MIALHRPALQLLEVAAGRIDGKHQQLIGGAAVADVEELAVGRGMQRRRSLV
ncbi:hypothetical protein D3C76_1606950 [compost metagenome]